MRGKVEILRDKNTKIARFEVREDIQWKLYAGTTVEGIDFSAPVAQGDKSGIFYPAVPDSVRSYFQVTSNSGDAIIAERHLPMSGGYNFRDLGGYRTMDGRYVKWGRIIRSDDMSGLTPEDLEYLGSVPLKTVVDLRSEAEIALQPDKVPSSVLELRYSITPGNLMSIISDSIPSPEMLDSLMRQLNRQMVTDSAAIEQFRKLFSLLQDESNLGILYHCSAGKDRTGMASALILSALGVDSRMIMRDYLLSNTYLEDKYSSYIEQYPQLKGVFEVRTEFLQAGLDAIRETYGSMEEFLSGTLGVNLEWMRERYLDTPL